MTSALINRRVTLARYAEAQVSPDLFAVDEVPVPELAPGQLLIRNEYVALEPGTANAIRGPAVQNKVPPVLIGDVPFAFTVGRVERSRAPGFAEGDAIRGTGGWQRYGVLTPSPAGDQLADVRRIDLQRAPMTTWLSVLGLSGFSAWLGLHLIGKPRTGQTVVVSAASGAVGSIAGQYARLAGARAVGIAGGPVKCAHVREVLGFDAAIDHRAPLGPQLDAACPDGIDVYFENVGGAVLDAVWPRMNVGGRLALCGMVSQYAEGAAPRGPNLFDAVLKRLTLAGLIAVDPEHAPLLPRFEEETLTAIAAGRLHHREDVVVGLERGGAAFVDLLGGGSLGKRLLRIDRCA